MHSDIIINGIEKLTMPAHRRGLPRKKTVAVVPRFVRLGARGRREGFGTTDKDATFTYLTLGKRNPVAQGPQKDAGYTRWAVTGIPRHNGLNLNNADAHYTHISPWV